MAHRRKPQTRSAAHPGPAQRTHHWGWKELRSPCASPARRPAWASEPAQRCLQAREAQLPLSSASMRAASPFCRAVPWLAPAFPPARRPRQATSTRGTNHLPSASARQASLPNTAAPGDLAQAASSAEVTTWAAGRSQGFSRSRSPTLTVEGLLSRGHLVHDRAEGEDVCPGVYLYFPSTVPAPCIAACRRLSPGRSRSFSWAVGKAGRLEPPLLAASPARSPAASSPTWSA